MSKKLEALEAWKDIKWFCYKEGKLDKQFDIIESALKRLEAIDNSVKFDMEYYEKRNQALEIIKSKNVNIQLFKAYKNNLKFYNMDMPDNRKLTQDEFDLLKEVLL